MSIMYSVEHAPPAHLLAYSVEHASPRIILSCSQLELVGGIRANHPRIPKIYADIRVAVGAERTFVGAAVDSSRRLQRIESQFVLLVHV